MDIQKIFNHVFYNAPIGMAIIGLDCQTFMVNPVFCKLLGYSTDEFLGLSGHDVTHPDDLDYSFVYQMINSSMNTYRTNKRYLDKQGNIVPVCAHYSLVADDEGEPLFFVLNVIELTEKSEKPVS